MSLAIGRGYTPSGEVCMCDCHVAHSGMRHILPCCSPNKPETGAPRSRLESPIGREVMYAFKAGLLDLNRKVDELLLAEYDSFQIQEIRGDSIASGYYPELKCRIIAADVYEMNRSADEVRESLRGENVTDYRVEEVEADHAGEALLAKVLGSFGAALQDSDEAQTARRPLFDPVWQDKRCLEWPDPPVFARDYSQSSIDSGVAHETFHFKLDRDRRLVPCDEKGEPLAKVDSDTLATQLSQHGENVSGLQAQVTQIREEIAALKTQQDANHAALLQAVNALTQPAATQPATTVPKE